MQLETSHQGDITIVTVHGNRVAGDAAAKLRDTLIGLAERGHKRVLLDFGEVDYLDSGGLGSVVLSYRRFLDGGNMVVVCPNPKVHALFQLTRIDKVLPVTTDQESGLKLLSQ